MSMILKLVFHGLFAMAAVALLTLPCAAQAKKKKSDPAKTVPVQPIYPTDFNPFLPMNP